MNQDLVWLDLCSGLGGASQPALDRGWKVIRVDIDPRFKPDIVADVRALSLKPFHVDVLWASFPCQDFSKWGMRHFYPEPPTPDLSIALAVKAIIDDWRPDWWVTENVRACRPFCTPIFGPVRAHAPGHVFFSNQVLMLPPVKAHKTALGHSRVEDWPKERRKKVVNGRVYQRGVEQPAIKKGRDFQAQAALIPYEIGEAICAVVERRRAEA